MHDLARARWVLHRINAQNCNAVATLPQIAALYTTTAIGCYAFVNNSGSGAYGITTSFAQMCYGSTVGNGIGSPSRQVSGKMYQVPNTSVGAPTKTYIVRVSARQNM